MTKSRHITVPGKQRAARHQRISPSVPIATGGKAIASKRRPNPETGITSAVLQLLAYHPDVAWAERINSGAMKMGGRYIKFGFTGCADVIGQMKAHLGGALLAIETKSPGKYPTPEQRNFLRAVREAGGCAGVARSVDDAKKVIDDWVDERRRWLTR